MIKPGPNLRLETLPNLIVKHANLVKLSLKFSKSHSKFCRKCMKSFAQVWQNFYRLWPLLDQSLAKSQSPNFILHQVLSKLYHFYGGSLKVAKASILSPQKLCFRLVREIIYHVVTSAYARWHVFRVIETKNLPLLFSHHIARSNSYYLYVR